MPLLEKRALSQMYSRLDWPALGVAVLADRRLLKVSGSRARDFLQGLITQDISGLKDDDGVYSLLLTPNGRYMADFFVIGQPEGILLDVHTLRAVGLENALKLYGFREKLSFEWCADKKVVAVWGQGGLKEHLRETVPDPGIIFPDPRHPELGLRAVVPAGSVEAAGTSLAGSDVYKRFCYTRGAPDAGDFVPQKTIPFEYGLQYVNALSLDKGCYLGQELIARTLHRGQIRHQLWPGHILDRDKCDFITPGLEILYSDRTIGKALSVFQDICLMRLEANASPLAGENVSCENIAIQLLPPPFQQAIEGPISSKK